MEDAAAEISRVLPGALPHGIDVFRGDGWQTLSIRPAWALRICMHIRGYVRIHIGHPRADTRMAIGVGCVDYVPEGRVSAGDGPAFRHSGKLLEQMSARHGGSMRYSRPDDPGSYLMDALVRSVGELADGWRPLQAKAVVGRLRGLNQKTIAAQWNPPVSAQAVSRHLKQARWAAVEQAISAFEAAHATAE